MHKTKPTSVGPTNSLAGDNPRHEVAGCPTALDPVQIEQLENGAARGTEELPISDDSDNGEEQSPDC